MKKHFKSITFFMMGVMVCLSSCKKEEIPLNETINTEKIINEEGFTDAELFDMIRALQIDNGALSNITLFGTEYILVGNDIIIPKDEVVERYNSTRAGKNGLGAKHHRATTIFNPKQFGTIDIYGLNEKDKDSGLSKKLQKALKAAVNAYNKLDGLSIKFKLKFDTFNNLKRKGIKADILVVDETDNEKYKLHTGAFAELPRADGSAGFLIETIRLEDRTDKDLKRLFIHELGHSIGFRHTDWDTAASCEVVERIPEKANDSGYGAIHIPGSPRYLKVKTKGPNKVTKKQSDASIAATINSIYSKCNYTKKVYNFTKSDKAALKKLFPAPKKNKKK